TRRLALVAVSFVALAGAASPARAESKNRQCIAASENGQRLRKEGKLRAAREQLLICGQRDCPTVIRQDCGNWMSEVTASTPPVAPPPPRSGGGVPVGAIVFAGIGVLGLGAGTFFWLKASDEASTLRNTCAPACPHGDVSSARTKVILSDVAFAIGGVSLAAA